MRDWWRKRTVRRRSVDCGVVSLGRGSNAKRLDRVENNVCAS